MNNPSGGMSSNMSSAQRPQNMDIKLLHAKKQQVMISFFSVGCLPTYFVMFTFI